MVALGACLAGPLAGVFDGAQGRAQLLAQLVAAQLGSGVGQVGAGLVTPPMKCFEGAVQALAAAAPTLG